MKRIGPILCDGKPRSATPLIGVFFCKMHEADKNKIHHTASGQS